MLTVKELRVAKVGQWLNDGGKRGAGALMFRKTAKGMVAYFRYTRPKEMQDKGKQDTLPIGQYDEQGRDGMTLAEARQKAGDLSKLYQSGTKDIRGYLETKEDEARAEAKAKKAALNAAKLEADAKAKYTLTALLDAYVHHLEKQGKKSARDAASVFKVHVREACPEIAGLPANAITPDHIAQLVRAVHEKGKERSAGVLRAYLQAAFRLAASARYHTTAPSVLIAFGIEVNPVDPVPAIPVKAGKRILTQDELREYMEALGDSLTDDVLRLHLLSGGQRIAQLLRAKTNDFDANTGILRLWDPKGRRHTAREHLLPLGPTALGLVKTLADRAKDKAKKTTPHESNPSLFLSIGGAVVDIGTPGQRVADISKAIGGEPFNIRDIRRTVETILSGMGISKETRAHLLSHGLGGVQQQHYDKHDYMDEKRVTLQAWEDRLALIETGKSTTKKLIYIKTNAS